jgi:hypothetical protein
VGMGNPAFGLACAYSSHLGHVLHCFLAYVFGVGDSAAAKRKPPSILVGLRRRVGFRRFIKCKSSRVAAFFSGLAPLEPAAAIGAVVAIAECFYPDVCAAADPMDASQFRHVRSFTVQALFNVSEANTYKAMGEISYMSLKRREAVQFIWSHPAITGRRVAARIFDFWFAVTDRPQNTWASDPVYLKAFFCLNVIFVVLSWFGLAYAWRSLGIFEIALYAAVVLVYPLAYYLMLALARYRYPVEPFLVVLAVYGLNQAIGNSRPQFTKRASASSVAGRISNLQAQMMSISIPSIPFSASVRILPSRV